MCKQSCVLGAIDILCVKHIVTFERLRDESDYLRNVPVIAYVDDRDCDKEQYVDGLMQESRNSIANALELRFSFINPSICNMHIVLSLCGWSSSLTSLLSKLMVWNVLPIILLILFACRTVIRRYCVPCLTCLRCISMLKTQCTPVHSFITQKPMATVWWMNTCLTI